MKLLAIDPSINSCGAAIFDEAGIVLASERIRNTLETDRGTGERCLHIALSVAHWAHRFGITALVSEWPQIYRSVKSKGDPNDLPPMCGVACAVAAYLRVAADHVTTTSPHEWIGNIPKVCPKCKGKKFGRGKNAKLCIVCRGSAFGTPRGELIRESLTLPERGRVADQHDVIDAVGIGLWKLKRLVTGRVFPGAV